MAFHVAPRDDVFYPAHVARRDEIDAAFIAKGTPDPLRRTSHEQLDNDAFLCHVQERSEEDSPPAEEDVDADRIFSGGFPYQASDVGKFVGGNQKALLIIRSGRLRHQASLKYQRP
jgi:hypothetical protein